MPDNRGGELAAVYSIVNSRQHWVLKPVESLVTSIDTDKLTPILLAMSISALSTVTISTCPQGDVTAERVAKEQKDYLYANLSRLVVTDVVQDGRVKSA